MTLETLEFFINIWNNYWTGDRILMAAWIFCAGVQAMETPNESSSGFYSWFFRFSHTIAGNTNLVRKEQGRFRDVEDDIRSHSEMANLQEVRTGRKPSLHEESVM